MIGTGGAGGRADCRLRRRQHRQQCARRERTRCERLRIAHPARVRDRARESRRGLDHRQHERRAVHQRRVAREVRERDRTSWIGCPRRAERAALRVDGSGHERVRRSHVHDNDDSPSARTARRAPSISSTQLDAAGHRPGWPTRKASTRPAPARSSRRGYYQPKHDPFIFFRDVSGDPPLEDECLMRRASQAVQRARRRPRARPRRRTTTSSRPNLCHDMHGQSGCPNSNTIQAGDDWLRENVAAADRVLRCARRRRLPDLG